MEDDCTNFTGIYVNEDRTRAQREMDKALRDERNRRNADLDQSSGRPTGTHDQLKFTWAISLGQSYASLPHHQLETMQSPD